MANGIRVRIRPGIAEVEQAPEAEWNDHERPDFDDDVEVEDDEARRCREFWRQRNE